MIVCRLLSPEMSKNLHSFVLVKFVHPNKNHTSDVIVFCCEKTPSVVALCTFWTNIPYVKVSSPRLYRLRQVIAKYIFFHGWKSLRTEVCTQKILIGTWDPSKPTFWNPEPTETHNFSKSRNLEPNGTQIL